MEAFWDRGVEAWGRDISSYAIGKVRRDLVRYCQAGSLTQPISGGPFDLVTCIEVLEHMEESDARQAATRIAGVTDCILFSSTPSDFTEPTHINVHPTIYWLKLFADLSFYPDIVLDASFVAPHAFVLRRAHTAPAEDIQVLFAETLRLRQQRSDFCARHNKVEELGAEVAELTQRLKEQHGKSEQQSKRIQALLEERDPGARNRRRSFETRRSKRMSTASRWKTKA